MNGGKVVHAIVADAVRDGRLTRQPCEECGNKRTVGHHDDYAKPLDVRWLCYSHHRRWHMRNVAKNKTATYTVAVSARLPRETFEALQQFAIEDKRSISSALRIAVRDYFAQKASA